MDPARINRALARLASEIVEENHGIEDLILVGIRRRGVPLANRIAEKIEELEGTRPPVGILDITLYRDDLSTVGAKPIVSGTELPGDIEARTIVLIDDVLYFSEPMYQDGIIAQAAAACVAAGIPYFPPRATRPTGACGRFSTISPSLMIPPRRPQGRICTTGAMAMGSWR